jgi:hypothetical protein
MKFKSQISKKTTHQMSDFSASTCSTIEYVEKYKSGVHLQTKAVFVQRPFCLRPDSEAVAEGFGRHI